LRVQTGTVSSMLTMTRQPSSFGSITQSPRIGRVDASIGATGIRPTPSCQSSHNSS
jgi:hypothetical protein